MIKGLFSAITQKTLHEPIASEKLSEVNNYFEVISDKYPLRPFVDLDGSFDNNISKEDFDNINNQIIEKLISLPNVSIMTSSNYESLKITKIAGKADKKEIIVKLSYRMLWTNEYVNNIVEMKQIVKEQKIPILEELLSEVIEVTSKAKDNTLNVDLSVYRAGLGKIRCVNAYKYPEQPERINKLVIGTIEDTIINIDPAELKNLTLLEPSTEIERKKKTEKKEEKKIQREEIIIEKKIKKQTAKEEKEIDKCISERDFTEQQIIELLEVVGNTADWDRWNTYGLALHDNWYNFEVFDNWSKKNKKYDQDITKKQWDTQYPEITGTWTIFCLLKDAKINNLVKYKAWCKKHKKPHIMSIFKQGANMFDEEYKEELFINLKYSGEQWFACNEKTNLWDILETPEKKILEFIKREMEGCEDRMKIFEIGGFIPMLIKCFKVSLKDEEFYRKICTPIDNIAFKNGLYNLKTKVFQKGFKAENYVSKTLAYDYNPIYKSIKLNKDYVITEFTKLFSNNPDLMDYMFRVLGFCLTGRASEVQQFFSIIGQIAGNGKSTLFIVLSKIFDIYVKKVTPKCFETNYAKAHKDLADLQGSRFLISEEFRKGATLNEQLVKLFRDGNPMENEVMFGTKKTIDLTCKLFFTSNNTLTFEADGGMSRGYRQVNFQSRFVEDKETSEFKHEPLCYQADPEFQNTKFLQPEFRDELLHILLDYANKYYSDGLKTPKFITEESKQTCEMQGDQFKTFFEDNFIINIDGYVYKDDITFRYTETYKKAMDLLKIKDEFQKMSYGIKYDRNKKGVGEDKEKRGAFKGISLKPTDS